MKYDTRNLLLCVENNSVKLKCFVYIYTTIVVKLTLQNLVETAFLMLYGFEILKLSISPVTVGNPF